MRLNLSANTLWVLSYSQTRYQDSNGRRREMSEKTLWIAFWSIIAVVVLAVATPLIILVPLILTLLFIGGGL
jgi:hypothetical protein